MATDTTKPLVDLTSSYQTLGRLRPGSTAYREMRDWLFSEKYDLLRDPDADPYAVAYEYEWVCEHCGGLTEPTRYQADPFNRPGRGMWLRPTAHGCDEETVALAEARQAEADARAAQSDAQWRARLERAGLAGRLESATFDSYQARSEWRNADALKAKVQEYTRLLLGGALEPGKNWLLLTGPVGTGKSHLAAAIARRTLESGRTAYFRVWTDYLKRIQASWDRRDDPAAEREGEILAELEKGWLVVIDDLDKRAPSEWVKGTLFSFLNRRYNDQLPTIITLNTDLNARDPDAPGRMALHDVMGGAVLDRTIESLWAHLSFDGPSFRSGRKMHN